MNKPARRILVVDDEKHIRESLVVGLNDYGWNVESACDGAAAMVYDAAFDAYVIDLGLPDDDGVELAYKLAKPFGDVPIIILSGFYTQKDAADACPKPVSQFVKKPFKFDELDQILTNLTTRRKEV